MGACGWCSIGVGVVVPVSLTALLFSALSVSYFCVASPPLCAEGSGRMEESPMRCEACGARAAVCLRSSGGGACPQPAADRPVRFCYVCGGSLRPAGSAAQAAPPPAAVAAEGPSVRKEARPTPAEPVSCGELRALLRRRLAARGGLSLIRCAPCAATCRRPRSPTDLLPPPPPPPPLSSSSSSLSSLLESCEETRAVRPWGGAAAEREPPELLAWATPSLRDEDFATATATAPPWLFARVTTVEEALAEMALEFNTRLASLQASARCEVNDWRQQTSELRAELRERREREAALLGRVEQLETQLRGRDEAHAAAVLEERRTREEAQRWRLQQEEKRQESLNAAYRLLCDTLGVCHTGS
ncbi:uncharacterized protein Tco025E_02922 [Trypanosoma conorhini]|uniref:Uncharacterized protein n=1 Tax=Trypanosoma conorhini TaxID=83891 RepID=A0A3R7NSZ5_9TRYP|nr:uncharacterized protein Tco025E_02922 [Trypanosoma conorhini]RNF23011.1 hypothetical protein Tco025E_02922 [Trypanosoma conorhini]